MSHKLGTPPNIKGVWPPSSEPISKRARLHEVRIDSAYTNNFSPAPVNWILLRSRVKSGTPRCCSSIRIRALTVDWLIYKFSAAWPKWRVRYTSRKVFNSSISMEIIVGLNNKFCYEVLRIFLNHNKIKAALFFLIYFHLLSFFIICYIFNTFFNIFF